MVRSDRRILLDHSDHTVLGKHYKREQGVEQRAQTLMRWEGWMMKQTERCRTEGKTGWPAFLLDR